MNLFYSLILCSHSWNRFCSCNMFMARSPQATCLEIVPTLCACACPRVCVCACASMYVCVSVRKQLFQNVYVHWAQTFGFCVWKKRKERKKTEPSLNDHWLDLLYVALIESRALAALILYICAIPIISWLYPFVNRLIQLSKKDHRIKFLVFFFVWF